MPQIQDCKRELRYLLTDPKAHGFVEISAGELHRRVFGKQSDQAAVCCAAMRSELRAGDHITAGEPSELSSSFTVRYAIPRPEPVVQGDAQD